MVVAGASNTGGARSRRERNLPEGVAERFAAVGGWLSFC